MKFKLDDVDHKILDLLIDNSRIPFTDIAAFMGWMPDQSINKKIE